jgi:DNA-binding transcriptional ArsR family regulator
MRRRASNGESKLPPTAYLIWLLIAVRKGRISATEIGRMVGLTPASVYLHLRRLKDLGYIKRKRRGTCWVEAEWEVDYTRLQSWLLSGRLRRVLVLGPRRSGSRPDGGA